MPANDPVIKTLTKQVRDAAVSQIRTYQISLCLMYLDRLGDLAPNVVGVKYAIPDPTVFASVRDAVGHGHGASAARSRAGRNRVLRHHH